MVALLLQPFIGLLHHRRFLATEKKGLLTFIHVWYGRLLIVMGIINGGLGLQLAANSMAGKIVYSVLGGIVGAALCIMAIVVETKRTWNNSNKDEPPPETSEPNNAA